MPLPAELTDDFTKLEELKPLLLKATNNTSKFWLEQPTTKFRHFVVWGPFVYIAVEHLGYSITAMTRYGRKTKTGEAHYRYSRVKDAYRLNDPKSQTLVDVVNRVLILLENPDAKLPPFVPGKNPRPGRTPAEVKGTRKLVTAYGYIDYLGQIILT